MIFRSFQITRPHYLVDHQSRNHEMNLIFEHHIFVIRCCCFRRNYILNVQGPTFSSNVIACKKNKTKKHTCITAFHIFFFLQICAVILGLRNFGIQLRLKTLKWSKKALFCTCVSNLHTKQTCKTSYSLLSIFIFDNSYGQFLPWTSRFKKCLHFLSTYHVQDGLTSPWNRKLQNTISCQE